MNNLIPIEHEGQRVITTKQLAEVYEANEQQIQQNFNNHEDQFTERVHYILLRGPELKEFKRFFDNIEVALGISKFAPQLYLWTERGANRHCKILDTKKAWEQFDHLEETYFAVKEGRAQITSSADPTKRAVAEAKLNNSRARMASERRKIAALVSIPEYKNICASYASSALAGKEVLSLPEVVKRTFTATEVGAMLGGLTGAKVGRIANQHGLKTPEYGLEVWDKSPYSAKQVPSWRYNENAVERLREILNVTD